MGNIKNYLQIAGLICMMFMGSCSSKQISEAKDANESSHPETTSNIKMVSEAQNDDQKFKNVSKITQKHVNNLVKHYSEIKNALVEGNSSAAQKASEKVISEINSFKNNNELKDDQEAFYVKVGAKLKNNAERISKNQNIDEQRKHFSALTDETYKMVKAFGGIEQEVYYQYCPMAFDDTGGYWLSLNKEIQNPYFGDRMLKCGVVRETIGSREQ